MRRNRATSTAGVSSPVMMEVWGDVSYRAVANLVVRDAEGDGPELSQGLTADLVVENKRMRTQRM